jgi:mRNA interferase HigB
VRVIARKRLRQFWERHPDAKGPLQAWFTEVRKAKWTSTAQIKTQYPSASFLANSRVIFNIKGNKYRLIIHFRPPIVFIRFIDTHANYNRIDPTTV